ncbi:hypothetical protein [Gimesia aquarii]|uniref:Uncharacterized protein n=1 Tax=Gimesia aquarii TaxID=2527964 RepID=A0A517W3Z8_9PLAN|nr:hypothetical protein [Gimesia aquarii]QDT99982.1 hypothetical protein V144x_54960 [Gimesia aquarii]
MNGPNSYLSLPFLFFAIVVLAVGCEDSGAPAVTTDMHEDFDHTHKHAHGEGSEHEHEHQDGFEGSHAHPHSHSHRHGEPLFGGKITSIGHSHHKGGEAHYHAEVMPVVDGVITFHLLTETADGKSKSYPVEEKEILSLINEVNGEPIRASELVFASKDDQSPSSTFVATIPDKFSESQKLLIVIPKITLGGERLNFSFTVDQNNESKETQQTDSEPDSPQPEKAK